MKFYSTNKQAPLVNFEEAVFKGLPEDNGLYMPEQITKLPAHFFEEIEKLSLDQIAYEVISQYTGDEIESDLLKSILKEVFNFPIPLIEVEKDIYAMELFHGPTCAFKDVGARFLARILGYFADKKGSKATILVATSGDTGSAVAHGFLGVKNIDVIILYPQGKVSEVQEKQLTTLGQNISALEIEGNFDDCQLLVKKAFLDEKLKSSLHLTSANSINIARLLPQSIYYFWAYAQLRKKGLPMVVSVPSGNYGNLSAGLMAFKMGLPIEKFIAASNRNDVVPEYISSGTFSPRPSVPTHSNAMDVGDPSNFARMMDLYEGDWDEFTSDVLGFSLNDEETLMVMTNCFKEHKYILDPHGAIGYHALKNKGIDRVSGVFLETAHPSKFGNVVELAGIPNLMPERLKSCLEKEKRSTEMKPEFDEFKNYLQRQALLRN